MKPTLKASLFVGATSFAVLTQGLAQIDFPKVCAPENQIKPGSDCATSNQALASASGNGGLVKVNSSGKLLCSLDDIHWDAVCAPVDDFIRGVTFANGQFVAVGGSYLNRVPVILTSGNGRRWTLQRCPIRGVLHSVIYGTGRFVAVGSDGLILSSPNGRRWRREDSGTEATLDSVAFGKGVFVAGGDDSLLLASTDGVRWTPRHSGTCLYISH